MKVTVVKSKEEEKPTSGGDKNTMGGSNGATLDATVDGNVKSDDLDENVIENFESTTRLRQRREM